MKALILFLAKLFGFSIVLYALHEPLMIAYEHVLLTVIHQFPTSKLMPPGQYYDSSFRLIPTLALLLATPRLSLTRRSWLLVLAVAVYWVLDFVSFYLWVTPPLPNIQTTQGHYLYSLIWKMIGQWVLPFLLWFVAAYRQLGQFFSGSEEPAEAC